MLVFRTLYPFISRYILNFSYLIIVFYFLSSCQTKPNPPLSPFILTSIAPYKYFIETIAGNDLKVQVFVPEGISPHSFEPTTKQMLSANEALVWFQTGDPFEYLMTPVMQKNNPKMIIANLQEGLPLLFSENHSHCHSKNKHIQNGADVHTWLSPKLAKQQAKTIAAALIQAFPERESQFNTGLKQLLMSLDQIDTEITNLLKNYAGHSIMVSHSAFSYFCNDYHLKQLSIECEGKDPKTRYATKIFDHARREKIHTVFVQKQCNNKAANRIANELGLKNVFLNPYSEDYLNNLRSIAQEFYKECLSHE